MRPHVWVMIGLALDIVGALLLAIEAITVSNLRRLFGGVHFLFRDIELTIREESPAEDSPEVSTEPPLTHKRAFLEKVYWFWWLAVLHIGSGLVVLFGGLYAAGVSPTDVLGLDWFLLLVGPLLLLLAFFAGELVHQSMKMLTWLPIGFLNWAEREPNRGKVGLAGAVLMVSGFAFQLWGTFSGR